MGLPTTTLCELRGRWQDACARPERVQPKGPPSSARQGRPRSAAPGAAPAEGRAEPRPPPPSGRATGKEAAKGAGLGGDPGVGPGGGLGASVAALLQQRCAASPAARRVAAERSRSASPTRSPARPRGGDDGAPCPEVYDGGLVHSPWGTLPRSAVRVLQREVARCRPRRSAGGGGPRRGRMPQMRPIPPPPAPPPPADSDDEVSRTGSSATPRVDGQAPGPLWMDSASTSGDIALRLADPSSPYLPGQLAGDSSGDDSFHLATDSIHQVYDAKMLLRRQRSMSKPPPSRLAVSDSDTDRGDTEPESDFGRPPSWPPASPAAEEAPFSVAGTSDGFEAPAWPDFLPGGFLPGGGASPPTGSSEASQPKEHRTLSHLALSSSDEPARGLASPWRPSGPPSSCIGSDPFRTPSRRGSAPPSVDGEAPWSPPRTPPRPPQAGAPQTPGRRLSAQEQRTLSRLALSSGQTSGRTSPAALGASATPSETSDPFRTPPPSRPPEALPPHPPGRRMSAQEPRTLSRLALSSEPSESGRAPPMTPSVGGDPPRPADGAPPQLPPEAMQRAPPQRPSAQERPGEERRPSAMGARLMPRQSQNSSSMRSAVNAVVGLTRLREEKQAASRASSAVVSRCGTFDEREAPHVFERGVSCMTSATSGTHGEGRRGATRRSATASMRKAQSAARKAAAAERPDDQKIASLRKRMADKAAGRTPTPFQIVAWSSQRDSDRHAARNLAQAVPGTLWETDGPPEQWLLLDFGRQVEVTSVQLRCTGTQMDPKDLVIFRCGAEAALEPGSPPEPGAPGAPPPLADAPQRPKTPVAPEWVPDGPWIIARRCIVKAGPRSRGDKGVHTFPLEGGAKARFWRLVFKECWGGPHRKMRLLAPLVVLCAPPTEGPMERVPSLTTLFSEEVNLSKEERDIRVTARRHGIPLRVAELIAQKFREFATRADVGMTFADFANVVRSISSTDRSLSASFLALDPVPDSRIRQMWEEVDTDGSAMVEFEEFLVWFHRTFQVGGAETRASRHSNRLADSATERYYASLGSQRLRVWMQGMQGVRM